MKDIADYLVGGVADAIFPDNLRVFHYGNCPVLKGPITVKVQYNKHGEHIGTTGEISIASGETKTFCLEHYVPYDGIPGNALVIWLVREGEPAPGPTPTPEPTPIPTADIPSAFQPYIVSISGLSASQDVSWKGVPVLIWWGEGSVTLRGRIKVAEQHATKAGEQISWDEYIIESGQTRTFSNPSGRDMSIYLLETEPTPTYACPYCPATFDTQEELDAHIASEHPEPPPPPPGKFTWRGCKLLYAGEINVDAVLAAGFNTALCYVNQARLDECLAKGLWVIGSIHHYFNQDPPNLQGAIDFVNRWKNHPAYAATYFLDEPDLKSHHTPTNQQSWYNAIKAADPNHDLLTTFTAHIERNWNPGAFDHVAFDAYPYTSETPDWEVRLRNSLTKCNASSGGIGGIAVVQAYHLVSEGMLNPTGIIDDMLRVWQEFGIGTEKDGYAMYAWTDGHWKGGTGISEDSALLAHITEVNRSYDWPHAPPGEILVFTCPYCGATFGSQAELDDHIASEHPVLYTCPYDGLTFGSQAELDAHIASEHPTNRPPTPPTSLLCEGEVAPSKVMNLAPKFSAIFDDPNATDKAKGYLVYVATTKEKLEYDPSRGQPDLWDSGFINIEAQNLYQGNRCLDIAYAGVPLFLNGKTYYWKILFEDVGRAIGGWSSPAQFTMSMPEETFRTQDITCSVCESLLRITISSIEANNKTLTCPLCETILPEEGTEVVVISTPLIDKLRSEIGALDEQIEQLEASAKDFRTQINTIKKMLGL